MTAQLPSPTAHKGQLKQQTLFSPRFGGWEGQGADTDRFHPEASPGSWAAAVSLCVHVNFVHVSGDSKPSGVSS